jgi:putative membrane protein
MTDGSSRLADGTLALNAGIAGDPADPANPGLLKGSTALATGASQLSAGSTKLASGSTKLSTGADKLADGNAKIAAGTGTLYSSAAAVSPSNMIKADVAVALGLVALLGLGAVGAYLALRNRRLAQERRLAQASA